MPRRMALTAAEVALIQERRRLDQAFNAGVEAACRCIAEWSSVGSYFIDEPSKTALITAINASERKEVL